MLIIKPRSVTLLGVTLEHVDAVGVDRRTSKRVEERTDLGPHIVFADAPEQRVTVSITRTLTRDEASGFRPGQQGELRFVAAPSDSDAGRRSFSATVVIVSVEHDLGVKFGARQRIVALAVSTDGANDPIIETTQGAA